MKYSKEYLEKIIKNNNTIKDCLLKMHGQHNGNNYTYFSNLVKRFNLDTSHFLTRKKIMENSRELNGGSFRKKIKNEDIFVNNSNCSNSTVKSRLIKENIIPYICNICKCDSIWQNKIMPLILDHKDGINNNNELSNLRFLCSNCDSIQDTYKGKNKIKIITKIKVNKDSNDIPFKNIIELIKKSNIDFNKWGWRKEVSILLNRTPQYSGKFIKDKIPELWEECRKINK
jgi:hypothetical protein